MVLCVCVALMLTFLGDLVVGHVCMTDILYGTSFCDWCYSCGTNVYH